MIQTEMIDGRIRSYSDRGMKLRQIETGIFYDDAVDVPGRYTYEETDIPIDEGEATAEELLSILLGGGDDD